MSALLSATILTPAAAALVVALIPSRRSDLARAVGLVGSLATLLVVAWVIGQFQTGEAGFQLIEERRWIPGFGIRYTLGVDGISLAMIALTGVLFPIALGASSALSSQRAFNFFMLALESALIGVFLSLDLFLFFVFWEIVLVPMYFIIGGWGHERRVYAALKFFLYTMAGSAFLLVGILALVFLHARGSDAGLTFDLRQLTEWRGLAPSSGRWLFLAFSASFAVKVPLFPFHTWLPDAHTEAPTAGSVVLAGVLLKLGAYGFLRFSLTLFPQAAVDFAPALLTLAVIGILYGAAVATMQRDLKRLVAYSSVAHLGFVVLGTFALTTPGLQGAVFTMVSHGLTTGALFLLVGAVYDRRHTRQIDDLGGLWKVAPLLGGTFLTATFASIGLPGLSGFVGEFLSLLGTFLVSRVFAVAATVGVILAAVYMLWAFQRVFTGEPEGRNRDVADLRRGELATVLPLLALSLVLGLYPRPLLERVEPSVGALVRHVEERTGYRSPEPGAIPGGDTMPEGGREASPSPGASHQGGR